MIQRVAPWVVGLAGGLVSCNDERPLVPLRVESEAFEFGRLIPSEYTCEGADESPPLSWTGAPLDTQSFALVVDDPDAPRPEAPTTTVVHWILYDMPLSLRTLAEGLEQPPEGAREGRNSKDETGYFGPCPGQGRHRYFFKLYALDALLGDLGEPSRDELLDAMTHHVLGYGELVGRYEQHGR